LTYTGLKKNKKKEMGRLCTLLTPNGGRNCV